MRAGFIGPIVLLILALAVIALGLGSRYYSKPQNPAAPNPQSTIAQQIPDVPHSELEKYLVVETALLGVNDNVSIYFKDLATANEVTINPTRAWIPASTIKAFVVPEAFRQQRLGIIDFSDTVTITAQNVVPTELETDDFPRLREGTTATIGQLVSAMIIQSDNTAYNTLLDVLDRRNINLTLKNLGITQTVVGEKLNLDDNQLAVDLTVPGRQPVTTTAQDLATLFDLMYKHKIASSDDMLEIFKKQKINDMIPAMLPGDLTVAHKTGDWAPIYHDGGIVYKKNNPFILTVFTNGNDPSIISRIARVAYFQNPESVGRTAENNQNAPANKTVSERPSYYIAQADLDQYRVLAAESDNKLPKITAADLGITPEDLQSSISPALQIKKALINPSVPLYQLKQFIENVELSLSIGKNQKTSTYLGLAQNRLAEFENSLSSGDLINAQKSLQASEQNLKQSVQVSSFGKTSDHNLLVIKQANDLEYKSLAQIAQNLPDNKKAAFVDLTYEFIKNNSKEVKPTINAAFEATRSTSQEPIIGTVTQVKNNSATLKFEDGTTKDVVLSDNTPARDYKNSEPDNKLKVDVNTKIAIIGQVTHDNKILPQFILRNVPKNLPDIKTGTVVTVDPNKNSLQLLTKEGTLQTVTVNDDTQIKSKDTDVSLEGIKAGSQVVISEQQESTSSASINQNTSAAPAKQGTPSAPVKQNSSPTSTGQSSSPVPVKLGASPNPTKPPQNQGQNSTIQISAKTITIVQNGSGKQEKEKTNNKNNNTSQPPPKDNPPKNESDKSKKDASKK